MAGAGEQGNASKLSRTNIEVFQCNLNKAHAAQVELLNKINKVSSFLALITEPYCYKKRLSIPPKGSTVIPSHKGDHPRAAIFASKDLKIVEIKELSNRDLAAGVVKLDGRTTVILSLYLDIKCNATPDFLTKALEYCRQRGYSVLIGSDTNSHSTLWGNETNDRGKKLENLIEDL